jgi:hypothetical protein
MSELRIEFDLLINNARNENMTVDKRTFTYNFLRIVHISNETCWIL